MPVCSVPTCATTHRTTDKTLYRFPKDINYARIWARCCMKKDSFNTKNAFICSLHFAEQAYVRDINHDVLGFTSRKCLRKDAIPTLQLPSIRMFRKSILQSHKISDLSLLADVDPALSSKRFLKQSLEFNFFGCLRMNKGRTKFNMSCIKCCSDSKLSEQPSEASFDVKSDDTRCLSEEKENPVVSSRMNSENESESE